MTIVQDIFNQLMPGVVPLMMTFVCMSLLSKKVNALWIVKIIGLKVIRCSTLETSTKLDI